MSNHQHTSAVMSLHLHEKRLGSYAKYTIGRHCAKVWYTQGQRSQLDQVVIASGFPNVALPGDVSISRSQFGPALHPA